MAQFTRSRAIRDADVRREGDVEPDDVPSVSVTTEYVVRSQDTAARGPESMAARLTGPESVPLESGPGISGSTGPLSAKTVLGGSGGHADPTVAGIPLKLS